MTKSSGASLCWCPSSYIGQLLLLLLSNVEAMLSVSLVVNFYIEKKLAIN